MATVNFSVPEEVKVAFNQTFSGRNKSAIIAELMKRAVDEEKLREQRARAMDQLMERRAKRPHVTERETRVARDELREWT